MKKREKKREWMTLLLLLFFAVTISAQGLNKKIDVDFKNTPLSAALKTIGKQSGVRVEFAYEGLQGERQLEAGERRKCREGGSRQSPADLQGCGGQVYHRF